MTLAVIIALAGLCGLQWITLVVLYLVTARERRDLYNRIQAGTLADYTANRPPEAAEPMRAPVTGPPAEEWPVAQDAIPEGALAESRFATEQLMRG